MQSPEKYGLDRLRRHSLPHTFNNHSCTSGSRTCDAHMHPVNVLVRAGYTNTHFPYTCMFITWPHQRERKRNQERIWSPDLPLTLPVSPVWPLNPVLCLLESVPQLVSVERAIGAETQMTRCGRSHPRDRSRRRARMTCLLLTCR